MTLAFLLHQLFYVCEVISDILGLHDVKKVAKLINFFEMVVVPGEKSIQEQYVLL